MDYFGDSNLFEDCFTSGHVSLADELDLGPGFDPLQLNAVVAEKHPGMAAGSMPSANQHGVDYQQQMGQFDGMKGQASMAQTFPTQRGDRGIFINEQSHFQDPTMNQAPQTNGLYPSNSPIWGEQRANAYHHQRLQHQQLQQHPQQRHKQHPHQQQFQEQFQHRQGQQRHQHQFNEQHAHLQQGQQVLRQHQLSAQHQMPHQQINPHTLHRHPKSYPDHTNFFYQGNVSSHQAHHGTINSEGSPFHPSIDPQSKSYIDTPMIAATSQQQSGFEMAQRVQGFHHVAETEDNNLGYHVQSSPAAYSLPSCSASMASSYPSSQYSFPGQPPPVGTSSHPHSTIPPDSEIGTRNSSCLFLADPLIEPQQKGGRMQVPQECPFRSLQTSKDAYGTSEMFSEGLASFPTTNSPFLHETENSHRVSGSGFQDLDEVSLLNHQHGGVEAIGEGHNILEEELLPELEAFVQEETSSWNNTRHDGEPRGKAVNGSERTFVDFKDSLTLHYKAQCEIIAGYLKIFLQQHFIGFYNSSFIQSSWRLKALHQDPAIAACWCWELNP